MAKVMNHKSDYYIFNFQQSSNSLSIELGSNEEKKSMYIEWI